MKISTTTYYVLFPRFPNQIPQWSQNQPGRQKLVNDEDESKLLQYIESCQTNYNCIRPFEARYWLENYIKETKGENIVLDRLWFYRFRQTIDISGTWLENTFELQKTPKGYMTHDSMLSWINDILMPYE